MATLNQCAFLLSSSILLPCVVQDRGHEMVPPTMDWVVLHQLTRQFPRDMPTDLPDLNISAIEGLFPVDSRLWQADTEN